MEFMKCSREIYRMLVRLSFNHAVQYRCSVLCKSLRPLVFLPAKMVLSQLFLYFAVACQEEISVYISKLHLAINCNNRSEIVVCTRSLTTASASHRDLISFHCVHYGKEREKYVIYH